MNHHTAQAFAICLGASLGALAHWRTGALAHWRLGASLGALAHWRTGALAHWRLGLWLSPGHTLAWGTLAANLLGAYLIGVCVGVFDALPQLDPVWRVALVTGFLGALTTFSSFSIEVVEQLQRYALALGITGLHLGGSLLLTLLGLQSVALVLAGNR